MKAFRQVMAATLLTATGCTSLQYATDPAQLTSPWYAVSYPAFEVVISAEGDTAGAPGQVNCFDDAGCIERLVASTRSSPESAIQLFVRSSLGSRFSFEYGPAGHGVRTVGWDADVPHGDDVAMVDSPRRWRLRSLTDPSAAALRLRIRLPLILSLPDGSEAGGHAVGEANPGLSFSTSLGARAMGVISITEFVERARKHGGSYPWFPVAACRIATVTLIASATDGSHEKIAEVSLPVPDVGHVLPVPFHPGSLIRLDPVCGVHSHD